MTERQQNTVDDIMDCFDFEKVHRVMKFLNWKWASTGSQVPEVYQMKRWARDLIKSAIKDRTSIATGGFYVSYTEEDNGDMFIDLSFRVEHWGEYVNEAMTEGEYDEYLTKRRM